MCRAPEHPVMGPPVRADDQEADHERQVSERILGEGGEQLPGGRALGDGQFDRQQRDRDGHHGVGEEHQPLGRAPGDVARLARGAFDGAGDAPVVGPRFVRHAVRVGAAGR